MQEYLQGQRIMAKTNIDIGIPVRRLEYVFVHEDAPGEKVTIPHDVTSPPEGGKVEVFLEEEIPSGQATGVYRLELVNAYYPDTAEAVEAITEELRSRAAFRIGLRCDHPPRASGGNSTPSNAGGGSLRLERRT